MQGARISANKLIASLTKRQAIVLVSLFILASSGFGALEFAVSFLSDDGAIINMAGRQRMLSQRVVSLGYQIITSPSDEAKQSVRSNMENAVASMEAEHQRLIEISVGRGMSNELNALYFGRAPTLDKSISYFIKRARYFMDLELSGDDRRLPLIVLYDIAMMSRVELLQGLESVVSRYQFESQERANRLLYSAFIGLLIFTFVLAFSWAGVFRPLARKLREELDAHQVSEEVKSSILDAALDAIVTIDGNGAIIEFNPAAERIFGHLEQDVVGKEIADLIIPEQHRAAHRAGIARVIDGGVTKVIGQRLEMHGLHADGHEIPLELAITQLPTHGLFTGFIRDLTGQKRTEEALRRSQKLEAVGQLTGGIAHDFNNLLGIITGNLELLQKNLANDEKANRRLDTALKSARRGADLTRRLLAFSRQAPTVVGNDPIDINDAVTGMLDMLQRSLTQIVQVKTKLDPALWKTVVNRSEFEDALLNLAINARDAMPDGGTLAIETSNIVVEAEHARFDPNLQPGEYIVLMVSDSGTGISKDIVDKIFEPFFTTKERGKGTGLGLSMVYGFARRSGGHVRVYSELGVGTAFRLYFPRSHAHVADPGQIGTETSDIPRGTETVLVIDDELHLAEIAGEFLSDLGYAPIITTDTSEAVRLLKERSDIDLIFSDVVMPGGLDGFGLAKLATDLGRKVLLTSGFTGYAHQHQNDGGFSVISKPYSKADLARMVRTILDGSDGS
ncbi:PAS domain S-box protein [Paramagnetospirillum magneticum]|nr:PAS domain S-box protein [Paramagnetospirillum magneticum]